MTRVDSVGWKRAPLRIRLWYLRQVFAELVVRTERQTWLRGSFAQNMLW
jgi:hypothetical protein